MIRFVIILSYLMINTFYVFSQQIDCSTIINTWSSGTVYNLNNQVKFNNKVYHAQWWTQGENPETSSSGVWVFDGFCTGTVQTSGCNGYLAWSASTPYSTGAIVERNCKLYKANYWTQNHDPLTHSTGSGVEWTFQSNCSSTTSAGNITFNPVASICQNNLPLQFIATPSGGTFSGTGVSSTTFNPSTSGSFQVTYTLPQTSGSCNVVSVTKTIVVSPSITQSPSITLSNNAICSGDPVTFTPQTTASVSIQSVIWYKNNQQIGTTTSNAAFTYIGAANSDNFYASVTATGTCLTNTITSSNHIVTNVANKVTPTVVITSNKTLPVIPGTSVTFSTSTQNTSGGTISYTWYKNGVILTGQSQSSLSIVLAKNDAIKCVIFSGLSCLNSNNISSNILTNPYVDTYSALENKLSSSFIIAKNNFLNFYYYEEYISGNLSFKIYDETNTLVLSNNDQVINKVLGQNYLTLNIQSLNQGKFYILEVLTEKKQKQFLKFKFN